jgi:hypothetical protein
MLRKANVNLQEHVPSRLIIKGSGGQTRATFTPWVGIFDPDESTTAEEGVYLVYLFSADRSAVTLCLAQGVTNLYNEHGTEMANSVLRGRASIIRRQLSPDLMFDLDETADLGNPRGWRQDLYEASVVLARRYNLKDDVPESTMRDDLSLFLRLFREAIQKHEIVGDGDSSSGNDSDGDDSDSRSGEGNGRHGGGGESEAHRQLKLKVSRHPELVGLSSEALPEVEHSFITGDRVDVYFEGGGRELSVVEVELEGERELLIGMMQAVKYRALAAAEKQIPNVGPSNRVMAVVVAHETNYPTVRRLAAMYEVDLIKVPRD